MLNAQHVVFEAAKAYKNGLPYHAALAGVTSASAELLGLAHRIGKVKAGFDADVVSSVFIRFPSSAEVSDQRF